MGLFEGLCFEVMCLRRSRNPGEVYFGKATFGNAVLLNTSSKGRFSDERSYGDGHLEGAGLHGG